ncbi:PP2C family protein-serine/threonine phosphatase [Ketobacter sp.]|uniref:PP2C family protein-serine/threonine phosphatase n=1 Tax=Ketobacter sp. TaxID=2083498 RepID=UPI000F2C1C8C|nr:protein phosphatase 2C domain-containing protein [Ketobacter sp.]RLU01094.1 MAG: serine/threonine-protein phosphatase [Ketobacter sp.]
MAQTHWLSSAATHCGAVRNMNEDAFLNRNNEGLWVVADGMGGHEAGEVASEMITTAMGAADLNQPLAEVVDSLEDALLEVHHKIRTYSRTHCEGRTMGSTVVSLYIRESVGICLWAGDSRLYRYRDHTLERISDDHSQVNEMLSRGMISPAEAINHPASNVITRAVGASETLYVDITLVELRPGDLYLLCSDGLYGALDEPEIARYLTSDNVETVTHGLIERSLDAGARDNVTVIAVKVQ